MAQGWVWDATCVDTFCHSLKQRAAQEAGGAATHAEKEKGKRYAYLNHAYIFQPIAFETSGTIGSDSVCFLRDLGRCLKSCTGEPNSFMYLIQHLSVAIQVGNSTSVMGSLMNKFNDCDSQDFILLHVVFMFIYFLLLLLLLL